MPAATDPDIAALVARAAAVPPERRSGTLRDLDHIVILMQENRGFDHYYGALPG
ncbi:putative phospholipase, partial [Bordetella bronchiseptica MO211]